MDSPPFRILLVDDDAGYADVIRHYLRPFQNHQFEVSWIAESEKALEALRTAGSYDLVLLDYFLRGTTGVDLACKIFEEKLGIPIILLTSNRDFRMAVEAIRYGIEDYLIKEEAVDSVLPRTIVNVIERRQLGARIAAAEKQKLFSRKAAETVQELVVTMCHEFNNPLAAIKISADIILRQKITDEQRAVMTKLNENIAHLERQIVKLRDLNGEKRQS